MKINQNCATENISLFDKLDRSCAAIIDFAIESDITALVTAEIAKKQHRDLLNSIKHENIFNHLAGFSLGKLGNGCTRIVLYFDSSKIDSDLDLAKATGCKYVERVPTGTNNEYLFNTENPNRMPLRLLNNPEKAFRSVLSELAIRPKKFLT